MAGLGGVIGTVLGWLGYQVGLRTDVADAAGSLHAKVKNIADKNIIAHGTVIKSIQRGVATAPEGDTTGTITISSVTTGKALVLVNFRASNEGLTHAGGLKLVLTNSTTLTWEKGYDGTYTDEVYFAWQVVEFY
jgi:hypothetical protein